MSITNDITDIIRISKALSDETRVRILKEVAEKGSVTCKSILDMMGLTQPTLSHHFSILARAELVNITKSGKYRLLTLNPERFDEYKALLDGIEFAK